jgi:radical SAM protein (TIGR04043 family)/putative N-acetyltransferase (TIGR04045 family)
MIGHIVTEIQSLGVRVGEGVLGRQGGAGPADAGTFLIDGMAVTVPTASPFVSGSPYSLGHVEGRVFLLKDDTALLPVDMISRPRFYKQTTVDGTPCSRIALLHGKDCLATSVLQTCIYWNTDRRCRFCGIELSLNSGQTTLLKSLEQLAETARLASSLDDVRHVVLTTGTARPRGAEIAILSEACLAIKKATDLPVHAQFLPPIALETLHDLKRSGVDTVGIHIESLDMEVLSRMAPVKAAIGLKRYEAAWKAAVEIFGPNQVSSFLIAGLGERPDAIVSGSERLAGLGVYPFIVPLRPIPGSLMADALPPDPGVMTAIYEKVAGILEKTGLAAGRSLAGCVRCSACSALPFYERPEAGLTCHPARTSNELNQAFDIRKEVFVQEQKIFETSDRDTNDLNSIHLVAKQGQEVVGTVRVFTNGNGNGHWIGGRLAVRKGYRASGAGELLVRSAVETVKRKGCSRFTAHIQAENVPFFSRLGWRGVEGPFVYFGKVHQVMEADLRNKTEPNKLNKLSKPA